MVLLIAGTMYYFSPVEKIPDGISIDHIVVLKSKRQLIAYSKNSQVIIYPISLRKVSIGAKQYEGGYKTPEGHFTINYKNPQSGYYKNLGISYPNRSHMAAAQVAGKSAGGQVKIHGIKNGSGFIYKFHRWRDWTNGCIALTNEEMEELYAHTSVGATIDIKP